jgi:beta-phosphoglucomutase
MGKIKAILFDMDGVLVDATEWHYAALNRALGLFGFHISRYDHLSTYNGLPTRKKLEMLSIEKDLPAALHSLLNRLKQVYTREEILTRCSPTFEKEYMISRLRREGYRLAVCSNSIRETTEMMIRRTGLFEYFDFLLSNEDVKKAKPDPEIWLAAMQRLEVKPDETVIVEDSPHGIESARRCGAHVCEVSGFGEVNYWRIRGYVDALSGSEAKSC